MRLAAILALVMVSTAMAAGAATRSATQASLLLSAETVKPGDTLLAAVRLRMDKGWHTYWRNSGESGAPTTIEWKLPAGVKAGEIQWPTPEVYSADDITTFVYHNEVTLLVPLTVAADAPKGEHEITAKVDWLECEVNCVPGKTTIRGNLKIADATTASSASDEIKSAQNRIPKPEPRLNARAYWDGAGSAKERNLILQWAAQASGAKAAFFPYENTNNLTIGLKAESLPADPGQTRLRVKIEKTEGAWPTEIAGLIVEKADGKSQAYEARLTIGSGTSGTTTSAKPAPHQSSAGFAVILAKALIAFLGGLILNLMPCVLPILSLKVLSFVKQGEAHAGERRRLSLIYALGVLSSFWILAGLFMFQKLSSYGEQFQDPRFIVIMTTLMTVVALNLFGVFEFILPGSTVSSAARLASQQGALGAFFNGILAVVLGASCVAPMMAVAVGWAVQQSRPIIFLIFSMIGAGLAAPYVLLSFFPQLGRLLPKPGAWMEKFKMAMGFPMLATAVWLFAQVGDHFGSDGTLWMGLFLVLASLGLWTFGEFIQRGAKRKGLAAMLVLLFLVGGYGLCLEHELDWRSPPAAPATGTTAVVSKDPNGIAWQPWSTAAVAKARSEGRPVFVDFTANWCLTCKLNKRTSIEVDSVRQKLKSINAVALLADYTRKDPAIADELRRFERAGVPMVLVYPKDAAKEPMVLPTVLTPAIVLDALEEATK